MTEIDTKQRLQLLIASFVIGLGPVCLFLAVIATEFFYNPVLSLLRNFDGLTAAFGAVLVLYGLFKMQKWAFNSDRIRASEDIAAAYLGFSKVL